MIEHRPQPPEESAEDFSIVLVGDFNPKIYQPSWFASQGLLRESEAEAAKVEIIHTDFTSFSTDWFVMQIARDRFTLTVNSSAYREHLRDLVLGTFHKLSHTPISQMGVNYSARLRFKSTLDWNCFGHFLLPKSPFAGLLIDPGMRSFAVQGKRPDDRLGYIILMADPVLGTQDEAKLRVNDHIERPLDAKSVSADFFLEILEQDYDVIINRSKELANRLIDKFVEHKIFDDGEQK